MKWLIKNGHVVDPANGIDEVRDILLEDTLIVKVAKHIKSKADHAIDAADCLVIPGIVDMHVHLRQPGREDKETVESGMRAALHGGVTSVLAMPNTMPAIDTAEHIRLLKEMIDGTVGNVFICAAITRDRAGTQLADIEALAKEGAVAISDDGASVDDTALMSQALALAARLGVCVACHCEDKSLSGSGVVNRGIIATRRGLRGISNESEFLRIQRDIGLAEKLKAPLHIQHVSCKESVDIIACAKKRGVQVTAETCPHYLAFTDEAVLGYDTNFKMNPPLRSRSDRQALQEALRQGVIDVIASDHAPHTVNEKDIEFDRAEFGVVGLETMLSVAIAELVETGRLSWSELVQKISLNPSRILKIDRGTLGEGKVADIAIIDPAATWTVGKGTLYSRSKNSPFLGKILKGAVTHTIWNGWPAYVDTLRSNQHPL